MPTARETRRGAPLFPAPPADAPDASPSWLRRLGFNLWLFACVLVAVALALTPLLFVLFPYAVVTFVAPGIAASWIAYLIYGAIVRLPPLTPPASGATSR